MGTIEIINNELALLKANIYIYGNAANADLAAQIADEINTMWTEAGGKIRIGLELYYLAVETKGFFVPNLKPEMVLNNRDPQNNYFRIEEFINGNISFVDDINCNTGFFKLDNLYMGSTTAAHEFGHTIGLIHPYDVDLRGKGIPGIMYPRGTWVDAQYQYNPDSPPGIDGGTMHPMYRKVWKEEVAMLQVNSNYTISNNMFVIGDFTNIWHEPHDMFNTK